MGVRPLLGPLAALLILTAPALAQDGGGFFSNLFGGGDDAEEAQADEDGGGFLERKLEEALSSEGTDVTIRGFDGVLSGEATVEVITIADADGVWLRLEDVVLDWNRSALLRRKLEVEELSAALVQFTRPPLPADAADVPSAEARPFSLPTLPVAVQIDRFAIERMELGEPVLGVETAASAEGAMSLEGGEGVVDIALVRLDGEGQLRLDASYSNASRNLAVDLELSEAEDGLFAALIDLPGRPSVDLTAQGEGPIDNFLAEIKLATAGVERLGGTVATTRDDGGQRVTRVDLSGDLAPVFAADYQEFFGEDVALSANVETSAAGTRIRDLRIDAAALDLQGEVEIGPDGLPRRIDLTGEIASEDEAPVLLPLSGPETRVRRATLDVGFDAEAGEDWTAELAISDLDRPGFTAAEISLVGAGRIARDPSSVTAAFDFAARQLDLGSDEAKAALGEEVTGRAEIAWTAGDPLRIAALTVEGESYGLDGRAEVTFADGGPQIDGQAEVRADRLAAFSGLAGRPLGGQAQLRTRFTARPLGGFFDVTATGTTTDLILSEPRADAILAGEVRLDLTAARDETGTRLEIRRLDSPNASLRGQATLTSGDSSASLSGNIADASIILPTVAGPLSITAEANAVDGLWTWRADAGLDGTRLTARGTAVAVLTRPVIAAAGEFAADDLSDFATLVDRPLSGAIDTRFATEFASDFSRISVDLDGTATDVTTGVAQLDPLLVGEVALDLDIGWARGVLSLNRSAIEGPGLRIAADGILTETAGKMTLNARLDDATRILPGAPAGRLEIAADLGRDGRDWTFDVAATGPSFAVDAEGTALDPTGAFGLDGKLSLRAEDLSDFSLLAGRPLTGALDIDAQGRVSRDLSDFDVTANGSARDVTLGIAQVDPVLEGDVAFDLSARRVNNSDISYDLAAQGAGYALDSTGTVTDPLTAPVWAGRLSLDARDLSDFATLAGRPLRGAAEVEAAGTVAADLSRIDLTASGRATGAAIGDARIDPLLSSRLTFDVTAKRAGEDIAYTAKIDGADLTLDSRGTLTDPLGTPAWDGEIDAQLRDASALSGLAGRPLSGAANLTARGQAAADLSRIDLTARATTRDLSIGMDGIDRLLAGEVAVSLDADRAEGGPLTYDLTANGRSFSVASDGTVTDLETAPVIDGRLDASVADLSALSGLANRPLSGRLSLDAEGRVAADLSTFDVKASANGAGLSAGLGSADALLRGNVIARIDAAKTGETIRLDELVFRSDLLTVTGSGTAGAGGETIDLTARLADISPFVSGFAGPATVDGTIARRAGGTLVLDLDATGPGGITATADGTLAPDFSTANIAIAGNAPLGLVNQFIRPRSILGTARFDLTLNGRPALENLRGTVRSDDARLVDPTLGFVFENIGTTVTLTGGTATLAMTATVPGGGGLSISGPLGLTAPFNSDLVIQLNDTYVSNPRLYETTVSGPIRVRGPLAGGATISGDLRLGETLVRIPSSGLGGAGDVPDVLHLNATPPIRATLARANALGGDGQTAEGEAAGPAYGLNITLSAPNRVFVRGRGLETEFGGQLTLRGTTRDIVPVGNFSLIRGRLDILGQRLAIEEATATLQGSFVPVVRIRASTDTDEYRINVIVSGRVSDPDITFTSEPDLPEEEVLARLLFGRGLDTLSPLQAARLALAVRTLAGSGGEGLVGEIRDTAGLADFDVTQSEDGTLAVRAGAYLSENIYTDVTVGAEGETEINLNLDLSKSVTVKGTVTSEGETSLGVFYERDY